MFIINKFKKLFETFGMLQKNATIVFFGPDNSGKTTLLHILLDDKLYSHRYSRQDGEYFVLENIRYKAYDFGGFYTSRKSWKDYMEMVDGIVFLVDSADPERFDETREELKEIIKLNQQKNVIYQTYDQVPILILGNKIDRPQAVTEGELRQVLGLTENQFISQDKNKMQINVFMCSILKRVGYIEGLKWLSQFIVWLLNIQDSNILNFGSFSFLKNSDILHYYREIYYNYIIQKALNDVFKNEMIFLKIKTSQFLSILVQYVCHQQIQKALGDFWHAQERSNYIALRVPILILGNKIDRPHAVTEGELREVLGIAENQFISQEKHQMQINVFMCSILKRVGYIEGLKWLSQFIV